MIALDPRFQELAELLGDENDLSTLSDLAGRPWIHREIRARICGKPLKTARRSLQKKAIKDAGKLDSALRPS